VNETRGNACIMQSFIEVNQRTKKYIKKFTKPSSEVVVTLKLTRLNENQN
jgi:hypothetical protein